MTVLPEQAELVVDLASNVATRVRGLMAEQRLNQADVARVLGVSRSGVSDRLNRAKDFDLKELPALADLLGESVQYLLGLTDVRHEGLEPPTRCFGVSTLAGVPVEKPLATVLQFRARLPHEPRQPRPRVGSRRVS